MTAGQRKYEEILRRELRAAAESMQPAQDWTRSSADQA